MYLKWENKIFWYWSIIKITLIHNQFHNLIWSSSTMKTSFLSWSSRLRYSSSSKKLLSPTPASSKNNIPTLSYQSSEAPRSTSSSNCHFRSRMNSANSRVGFWITTKRGIATNASTPSYRNTRRNTRRLVNATSSTTKYTNKLASRNKISPRIIKFTSPRASTTSYALTS